MKPLSKFFPEKQLTHVAVLCLLLILLTTNGISGYTTGSWQWKQPPDVPNLRELREIRKTGITLPDWQTVEQIEQVLGTSRWSLQILNQKSTQNQAILLLHPQNSPMDQPEVEWTDINSWGKSRWQRWDIAQFRSAEFTLKRHPKSGANTETKVEARFFRVSTQHETFAVLQWYATPNGGHPLPWRWFLADQLAQWHQKRIPWVSVSIMIPMEPLGQVVSTWALAQSIGQTVQTTLMANFF
ncbi:cyanoexosortase B system-associated protein [Umezakia ovalisporum]|jgi:cyanoexosortase B-associated protein|uniref:Cyanoexosortase B system-associated protein n=1 Tax=Umezakia ovalisporum FSS-43 TaxID=2740520 RepID=A0ABT6K8X0_9CYAN|nr:cyanoexosortase B system-associated protein [Umezakia ovalisporum]MBI1242975.1 cyanoexosortase B system-associated protein [Nostoc sp. RI_552]MDH6058703.1 cyanoexosortase B system-associated protein [Umezakia ovalisporum FSS-43]MDH6068135.1 cyanoexosortase B system-associated protein [Umezakia ovalisporum APH033B]MDH6069720.1 cyanoexosortase B system-associated protein [Umezakia ovalisporum CobakiLakeA]MDH6074751.1 cyanoexosortase B system-associated protein [Umezakia ovalisporum CS-1034]